MSLPLLRQGFRSWFTRNTRIDQWDLDYPANAPTVIEVAGEKRRYAANCAVELPVMSLSVRRDGYQIEASGRFVYILVYRFSGKASKEQLPIKAVENSVNYLLQEAVLYPADIWEKIRLLEVAGIEQPVSLSRVEGEDGDWLIIGRLEFDVRFLSLAESDEILQPPLPPETPTQLTRLEMVINRSLHPVTPELPETFTEDARIVLSDNP